MTAQRNEWLNLPPYEERMKGGFSGAGGLRDKSYYRAHFLFVMVASKGRVDHDVWPLYVVCLCCATLCPFKHLILFLEQYSRSTHRNGLCFHSAAAWPWQEKDHCWTGLWFLDRLPMETLTLNTGVMFSRNGFNRIIKAGSNTTDSSRLKTVIIFHNACYAFPLHL